MRSRRKGIVKVVLQLPANYRHTHFHLKIETEAGPQLANINQKLDLILMKLDELVTAATELSTASDSLSIRTDTLVSKVDAVLAALQNADLPAAAVTAVAALKAAKEKSVAAGDKVDASVATLDTILDVPAPAGDA